jgi:predicted short-subunit dehydrogenase-like oxidoreductase (DUF2520 family)
MPRQKSLNVAIIGAGKVGSVLGRVLAEEGERVVCVVSRTEASARKAGRFIGCKLTTTDLACLPPETDCVFITTPHGAVAEVAKKLAQLAQLRFHSLAACHASGMHTAAVLDPLRRRGATVFSFHPLQTFPRDFEPRRIVPNARGISYGVDGSAKGVRMARLLATKLGGHVVLIPPEMRVLYHAACVVASNHLTTMMSVLETMFRQMGRQGTGYFAVFQPIIEATLDNIAASSPAEALSGPIARGGRETLREHLDAIRRFTPALLPYFASVSLETVRLAQTKGSITAVQATSMKALIRSTIRQSSKDKENR